MAQIEIEPELGIPYNPEVPYMDLRERAEAMCSTATKLMCAGLKLPEPDSEDVFTTETLVKAYANDAEGTSKKVTHTRAATMTPQSMVMVGEVLKEFSHSVVNSATEIRHMVTNKLILESENPDPRVRLKALELLGKISDVGLFSEKTEVTVTHQSSDELRSKLRGKLERLINPEAGATAALTLVEEPTSIALEDIDVDEILGN